MHAYIMKFYTYLYVIFVVFVLILYYIGLSDIIITLALEFGSVFFAGKCMSNTVLNLATLEAWLDC